MCTCVECVGYAAEQGSPAEDVQYRECLECPCVAESTLFVHSEGYGGYYCPDCGSAHTVVVDPPSESDGEGAAAASPRLDVQGGDGAQK